MTTLCVDGTAEVLLNNILMVMSNESFSKEFSMKIVGGEKKLTKLIENGSIAIDRTSDAANAKWLCNAADVLKHCKPRKLKKKLKKSNRK